VLFSSWEDVVLAYMAPRSGKSTALAIPAVLSAPGAVIATSNKADVWSATAAIRADETGERVWTFDPKRIAWAPQTWWWDPLADLTSVEEAERLASHFVLTVEDDRGKDIWGPAAQELLAALMLAARSCGGTMHDVYDWLNDEANPVPVQTLKGACTTWSWTARIRTPWRCSTLSSSVCRSPPGRPTGSSSRRTTPPRAWPSSSHRDTSRPGGPIPITPSSSTWT